MLRIGKVVKTEKDHVLVCFSKEDMCGHCNGCDRAKIETSVKVLGQANEGDIVSVALPDHKLVVMSAVMYLLPVIMLVIGLIIGEKVFQNELLVLLMGIGFLALSFLVVYLTDRKLRGNPKWQAYIVETKNKN